MVPEEIEWELVNPQGVCKPILANIAARPSTLEDKTIGLYWNAKNGGKEVLERIAGLLGERFKGLKVIKYWEAVPESRTFGGLDPKTLSSMASLRADIVICSHGD
ncbi:MAG: hypothetical protein HYX87_02910 [Chloroflexi bacterium]|nr:hypothetical protein [Chloroflexota bacterium]